VSFSIDVNVLLYASDKSSPFHLEARNFLGSCTSGSEVFYISWTTLMSYLRIATHPAIFADPLSPVDAVLNVDSLLALPHVRVLAEDEDFWTIYHKVVDGLSVRGNLVNDAHLAALLWQHGVKTLYTNDTDFRKFRFLDVQNPFAPRG
jgi:hypothetical protein